MAETTPKGKFITFEGGEGTGKSTHARRLARVLENCDIPVVVTREPGGSPGAEEIRALIVTGAPGRWTAQAELLMMNAARDDHLNQLIRPELAAGRWIICDRFSDSTRAYQGIAGGVPHELVEVVELAVVGDTRPDLTFVLDLDPATGLERAGRRQGGQGETRFEVKGLDFHRRLRQGFLDIAAAEPERCVIVDAGRPIDDVSRFIEETLIARMLAP